ncbi:acyl-CoA synthetase FdrA [Listeria newyorkensis]|uniref:Acyl-CoA synthetase FdrA n=1 Tax=Listeria newyorkensis TaxID=1497681 RepID=A0ABX4XRQ7_9LIST|nr:acyl-CoA synthetase FdrA [Listeria newyorkensis]KGL43870.1 membrane protein [Listeria newyorkensis]PNP94998.1 acyl-CoA synthetase FdrA [Listeria newyorkensis]WAO21927.1 acyl-CoA synthetase FdrA [Listeria newyorkensis]SQC59181.1 membrane protein FdrA [Listeria newyorkensis]
MLHTIIKENAYQDSVVLMLLTNKVSTIDGVNRVSIMMGTPANKDIFGTSGLRTEELEAASANDMAIVVDTEDASKIDEILAEVDAFLASQATKESSNTTETARTWDKAMKLDPDANMALISIPGTYAVAEADRALDEGLHAFIFSDNMPIEEELRLKQKAHDKGLFVMGPDCGTGIVNGVPMAFTNVVKPGNIGIVGASGTGIQEVSTIIDRLGGGVTNAIGTGGRDLSETVGGITMLDAIAALEKQADTDVIVVISKPPAKAIRDKVLALLRTISKPAVTIFLGEKPTYHEANLYHAYTLEETARIAVELAKGEAITAVETEIVTPDIRLTPEQKHIKGYYSGGTLASEAAMLIADALQLKEGLIKQDGYILKTEGHEVIDLGDDIYTQGKPHPMIDPEKRIAFIEDAANDPETAVILLDVVLGYGSHEDMAGQLAPAIKDVIAKAKAAGRELAVIGTVCGTLQDPQDYKEQRQTLENSGVIVKDSNNEAVRTGLALVGRTVEEADKAIREVESGEAAPILEASDAMLNLLAKQPRVINVGLKSFAEAITETGGRVVQFDWRPVAGGNTELQKVLQFLNSYRAETADVK